VKAVEHAQVRTAVPTGSRRSDIVGGKTYWNLLEKVQPRELKLTACVAFAFALYKCVVADNLACARFHFPENRDLAALSSSARPARPLHHLLVTMVLSFNDIRYDDDIIGHAKTDFPELFQEPYEKLVRVDEEWMKSKEGKERWRKFLVEYVPLPTSQFTMLMHLALDTKKKSRTTILAHSSAPILKRSTLSGTRYLVRPLACSRCLPSSWPPRQSCACSSTSTR
jgi:hypothetical protein